MPRTPDRTPGVADEEGVVLEPTVLATTVGEVRYDGARFSMQDATGEFDPRSGSGLSVAQHKSLRDLIHFIDDGPADGFVTAAFKESIFSGALLTNETWYESVAKTQKIVQLDVTYSGVFPSTEVWEMYDTDGTTVLVTLTDTITYSGAFEADRTRTWV